MPAYVETMPETEDLLVCRGVSKRFGGTQALRKVDLRIKKGEVHALLGENGAGKSTLMKCIIGLIPKNEGEIYFQGQPLNATNPSEALNAGISMIHQELNLLPDCSIAENIFLKREDTRGFLLDKKKQNAKAAALLRDFNLDFPPTTLMKELTIAQAQMIEIIKAVSTDARLIIMDEPTSSLDQHETDRLFKIIRELKAKGVSIIYISHRMEEIFDICDRVSVFRDGEYIGTKSLGEVDRDQLITMMVGRKVENIFPKTDVPIGEVMLEVKNLCGKGFEDISFHVREGEILGLSGLVGSGRSESMLAIFGMNALQSGQIFLNGEEITIKSPSDAIARGICMVNENRQEYGLCINRPILENISLPTLHVHQEKIILDKVKEMDTGKKIQTSLSLKTKNLLNNVLSLSGGNQQKVVFGKWLIANPRVLILDEPTRGVDVGAKAEIHALISQLAARKVAIIMISSELPEIMGMSDRILVYKEGQINGEFQRSEILAGAITQEDILAKAF